MMSTLLHVALLMYIEIVILGNQLVKNEENIITYEIDEELPVGRSIGESLATKLAQHSSTYIEKTVISQYNPYFEFTSKAGDIKIKKRIDLEDTNFKPEDLTFRVVAIDDRSDTVMYKVKILVNDINDNPCHFDSAVKKISFSEKDSPPLSKEIPSPSDPDKNYSVKKESIVLEPATSLFYLKRTKSFTATTPFTLDLVLNGSLDYEKTQQYTFNVKAHDGNPRNNCTLRLIIDVLDEDDNAPQFTQDVYQQTISESTQVGTEILQLKASDKDSGENAKIKFNFDRNPGSEVIDKFIIKESTGKIVLKKKLTYSKAKNIYKFKVKAHSGTKVNQKSTAEVVINIQDENDQEPKISVFMAELSHKPNSNYDSEVFPLAENEDGNKFLHVVIEDDDSDEGGRVECHLKQKSSTQLFFNMERMIDKYYLISSLQRFDREAMDTVDFVIKCQDQGKPPLSSEKTVIIKITDKNDNPPKFKKTTFHLTVMEDTDPARRKEDYKFAEIVATDEDIGENAKITYSIGVSDNEILSCLKLDPHTGILSSGCFDRETKENFSFTVCARNDAKPYDSATATVSVKLLDYNDHRPKFTQNSYVFEIKENNEKGVQVGLISASDKDIGLNAKLNFSFVSVPRIFPFSLRETYKTSATETTSVELYTTGRIDRETTPSFRFTLRVRDLGSPVQESNIQIIVDVLDENDNKPEFTMPQGNTSFPVSFREIVGYQIAKITALDRDAGENGKVFYRLQNEHNLPFKLDPGGALTIKRKLQQSSIGIHRLVVFAYDNGTPKMQSEINIDIHVDDSPSTGINREHIFFGDASMNMYIIIGIVVASFVIAMVLLTAICVVLKRSRRELHSGDNYKTTGDYVMCPMNSTAMSPAMSAYHSATMPPQTNREVTFLSAPSVDNIMLAPMKPPPPYHAFPADDKRNSVAFDDRDSGNGDSVDVNTSRSCTAHGPSSNTMSTQPTNDFFSYPSASTYSSFSGVPANSTATSTFVSTGLHSRTLKTFGGHTPVTNFATGTLNGRHLPSDTNFHDTNMVIPKSFNSSAVSSSGLISGMSTLSSMPMSSAAPYHNATFHHATLQGRAESRGLLVSGLSNQPLSNHSTLSNKSQGGSFV